MIMALLAHVRAHARVVEENSTLHSVQVTLLNEVPLLATSGGHAFRPSSMLFEAHRITNGGERTKLMVIAPPGTESGTTFTMWLHRDTGAVVKAPTSHQQALVEAAATGLLILMACGGFLAMIKRYPHMLAGMRLTSRE
ncbi:hypothetical protein ACFWY5_56490 [Nonomuraea sp. NPDC059007]|uniref:hypothetical protein n=1 Tax=Nonomuraea sp. NPDC059007 TaxID=3346692 RepID=UPI0036CFF45E